MAPAARDKRGARGLTRADRWFHWSGPDASRPRQRRHEDPKRGAGKRNRLTRFYDCIPKWSDGSTTCSCCESARAALSRLRRTRRRGSCSQLQAHEARTSGCASEGDVTCTTCGPDAGDAAQGRAAPEMAAAVAAAPTVLGESWNRPVVEPWRGFRTAARCESAGWLPTRNPETAYL